MHQQSQAVRRSAEESRTKSNTTTLDPVTRLSQHSSAGYEKIRVVGKGSFGLAILYRRKDDESLVILKEINLHELSFSERQLAMNEVSLLSRLDHPHIISYYDSFEEDGVLMIEMEYADGGTLAQFLARQTEFMRECDVMFLFEQMISAVSYLHDNNVLHRDLKTANIFLTKDNMVKVGDFGISKRMGTATKFQGAQTILGTPYYLSPEMCEGKSYNEKSDIWALGCCLYEMMCLQKAFDGSSLPALVTKIVNGEYEQIKNASYSNAIKLLVDHMLKTNPDQRPTAASVVGVLQRYRSQASKKKNLSRQPSLENSQQITISSDKGGSTISCHSALYRFCISDVTLSACPGIPAGIKIKQISIGKSHQMILSSDSCVYSWGDNQFGQLGHGDRLPRNVPVKIEALEDKTISKIAVGNTFSIFCVNQGIALACGNKKFVGNGEIREDVLRPKIVDGLLREDIVDLSCGEEHCMALCENGQVFAWGNGVDGRLGIGNVQMIYVPTKVEIPTHQLISNVRCGPDCTFLITCSGTLIAMGSNKYNKLNLNFRLGFFANVKNNLNCEVDNIMRPTPLKPFPSRVVDISPGPGHSGVLLENGHVHLFGRNADGELGVGNRHVMALWTAWRPVKALQCKACVQVICGEGFTMAATSDNELYFWGYRGIPSHTTTITLEDLHVMQASTKKGKGDSRCRSGERRPKNSKQVWGQWGRAGTSDGLAITQPTLVLRLDVTKGAGNQSTYISMALLVCSGKSVMAVIDTASPTTVSHVASSGEMENEKDKFCATQRLSSGHRRRRSAPEGIQQKQATGASLSTWIQKELDNAEYISYTKFMSGDLDSNNRSTLLAEQRLLLEIDGLKKQLQEQSSTFKGHEAQMDLLQKKLLELQALQKHPNEPPPAYAKPRALKNSFLPETTTKVCNIL